MSIGKKVIFILIISIFFIEFSFGYEDDLRFKYLNLPGVPSDAVLNVAQDSTGYIWITARKTGLFKYDGNEYTHYPEIKKPWTIIVSPSNNIVVGSKLGIYKYNRLEDKFDQIIKNTIAESYLRLFYFDDVNTILRRNDSLFVYNESNQLSFILDEIRITDIKKIDKNLFIASAQSGIYEINISEKETRKITNLRTFKLHHDGDDSNTFWFGYFGGIGKYNLKTSDLDTTNFTTKLVITDILRDSKNTLLLATTNGLYIFNKKSYKVTLKKFNESWTPSIIDMIIDNTKTYWFATFKGLIKSDLKQTIQNYFPSNNQYRIKRSDNITTMCSTSSDNVWFVSNETQINLLDGRNEIIPFEIESYHYGENKIRNILVDQEGYLWVSSKENVKKFYINKSSNSLKEVQNTEISHPVFLKKDKFSNIWISSFKNLFRYNSKGLIKKINISNATAIHVINDSICFLGVHSKNYPSIRKLNYKTGEIEEEISLIKYRPQIGGLAIKNLIYDTLKEKFYIGTSTTGLITIDRNESISIYSTSDGMPANNILGMVFDSKERLWLNTPDGLVLFEDRLSTFDYTNGFECYRKLKRNQLVKYSFYSNNLILSNAEGSIFLGGRNGLTSFNPDLLLYKSEKTDIILNSIHLYGEEIYRDKVINDSKKFQFSYKDRILTFNFAIMNFKKPEANKYAFKLENFN